MVSTVPPTGATDVHPGLTDIRVTFNRRMQDGNWSWVQLSKESLPETTGKPHYEKDRCTCILPVKLKPGTTYAISINPPRFANFRGSKNDQQNDQNDRAVPYLLVFKTKED